MPTIAPDQIKVAFDRIREELGDIDSMAESIKRFGQLQPIIVDDDFNLIDGFRRWTVTKHLGIDVWYERKGDVDELLSRELELEANLQRKDMTWQERAKGLAELDRIKRERNPGWNQQMSAAVAGVNQREISQSIQMTKLMEIFPEVREAKNLSQAVNIAKRKASQTLRRKDVEDNPDVFKSIEERVLLGDSVERIKSIPDGSFHAIITDPPFGVDYEDKVANTVGAADSYEDDRDSYRRILSMAPDLYRVLRRDGWLVWFCGISWYEQCKQHLRAAGFTVDEIPIIWDRTEGRTFTSRPDRWFGRGYDIALHALKGEPQLAVRGGHNIIRVPPVGRSDKDLTVERPVELYADLIKRLTVPGEVVADFFVGSGSCLAAAASLGRGYFGCELDVDRRAHAIRKIRAYTPGGE